MKKNKIFAVLSLSLIGVLGLTSCAPAVVTPEEGKQALAGMKKAYEDGKVENASSVHASYATASEISALDIITTVGNGFDVMLDRTNFISYVSAAKETKISNKKEVEKKTFEFWAYYEEGQFITALQTKEAKIYSSVPVNEDAVKATFDDSYGNRLIDHFLDIDGIDFISDYVTHYEGQTDESYKQEYGASASIKIDSQYRSNMEDVFQFDYSAKIAGAAAYGNVGGKAESNLYIAIDNYRVTELSAEEKYSATVGKNQYINNQSQSIIIDYSARINKPNIKDFTKGIVDIPNL